MPTEEQQEGARELNREYDSGSITREQFLDRIEKLTGHSSEEVEYVLFGGTERKNRPLLKYLEELKNGYKLSILSNVATNWVRDELLTESEQKLFSDMVFSFEQGMTKPDPKIFHLAAKRLMLNLDECVLVDDIERYCEAAKQQGMKAVLYENFDQMKHDLGQLLSSNT